MFTLNFKTLPILLYILTRGGNIDLTRGSLWRTGGFGKFWGATAYSLISDTYFFTFDSATVNPSYYGERWLGFTVRRIM